MVKGKGRERIDRLVLERGLFQDLRSAQAAIMAGEIRVDNSVVTKPGALVRTGSKVSVRHPSLRFASRGGYKLEKALSVFHLDVTGCVALDAGASTGGFTDCLLRANARRVYAVDVGFGQLRGRLAADSRVVVLERTNISDLTPEQLDPLPDLCTVDLSYISLRKAVRILRALRPGRMRLVCLVKPLFEGLERDRLSDEARLEEVLESLFRDLLEQGSAIRGVTASPVTGSRGSVEFLVLLEDGIQDPADARSLAGLAIADIRAHPPTGVEGVGSSPTDEV